MNYEKHLKQLKAISDLNRLKIIEMLGSQELCACDILDALSITQPTLSHHMKVLCDVGLINCRKDGKWQQYSLNVANSQELTVFIDKVLSPKNEKE